MDPLYFATYNDESQIPVTISVSSDMPFASSLPHQNPQALGYSPYTSPDPNYGDFNYQGQPYQLQPTRSNSYSSNHLEIPLEYYQEFAVEDFDEMPESERALARERRKAQNRAAQKAFRRRKGWAEFLEGLQLSLTLGSSAESRIRELEQKLGTLQQDYKGLENAFEDLRAEKDQLQSSLEKLSEENNCLRNSIESSPASINDLSWWPLTLDDPSDCHVNGTGGVLPSTENLQSRPSGRSR
ncbi:hypothetical protein MMC11_003048 [Xylographa trunciseda]|nr:hypothetical protein [Xylographa trunciseda]